MSEDRLAEIRQRVRTAKAGAFGWGCTRGDANWLLAKCDEVERLRTVWQAELELHREDVDEVRAERDEAIQRAELAEHHLRELLAAQAVVEEARNICGPPVPGYMQDMVRAIAAYDAQEERNV